MLDLSTAREELHSLDEETGLFGKMPDELMNEGKGETFSSRQQMSDPMAGLFTAETPQKPVEAPESDFN
jgi:hypothetical protein